jgi:CheY-like chemotaxis protein
MVPTILVLDRNSTVQRVLKLSLKEESVRVNTIQQHSGDVFASIDAHPPAIIFTDDARKVVEYLKSRPKLARIPVVLLKGAFASSAAARDEECADEVLTKPLQPDAVIDCVKRLLRTPTPDAPNAEVLPPIRGRMSVAQAAAPAHADLDLDLEQYFDQLDAAFNEADGTSSTLEGESWDGGSSSVVAAGQKRAGIARTALDRPSLTTETMTTELVDHITQRVLDRLGDRIVRSTATEVVSRLSKWLLVNEVERSRNTQ